MLKITLIAIAVFALSAMPVASLLHSLNVGKKVNPNIAFIIGNLIITSAITALLWATGVIDLISVVLCFGEYY